MDMMEQRNKHLQNVINRFGQYDSQEFEFDNDKASPSFSVTYNNAKNDQTEEI